MTSVRILGHAWTLLPHAVDRLRTPWGAGTLPWRRTIKDAVVGPVTLSGALDERPRADTLVVVVHGLGGSHRSGYCARAAANVEARGWSCLRISLRGADRRGEDLYHAGLTADLEAALGDPAFGGYRRLFVLGFSLGGHETLRLATSAQDERLRGVATICAPVDLAESCAGIDRPRAWLYRHHVLEGLQEMYRAVQRRHRGGGGHPLPRSAVHRIATVRDWDHRVIAPRHGFVSAGHYYAEMSVGPRLDQIAVPALFVATRDDPMVTKESVLPALARANWRLDVRWLRSGGHVGFPPWATLGLPGRGIVDEALGWLDDQS